jgi:peptidyl-prolyl cis-trans isomerase SurA
MKKNIYILLASLFLLQACKQSQTATKTAATPPKDPIIATFGSNPVHTSEFAYVYNKNNSNSPDAYTSESVKDYLRLYINFRLKVKEAEELGLDTAESFKKELEGYKKQLSQPYFTEKSVTEKLTQEAYERMKEEINASHILIRLSPDADPKDTLEAYNKIKAIKERIMKGESFEVLASQLSEDPSAKNNRGNLGYFTAFGTIYPFETAAYNTQIGSVSDPVRTQFGYHIIKVNNRRSSQGQVKVAHIMVRASEGMSESDSIAAREKIFEIHSRLLKGEDWNSMVTQFSEDGNSKSKGGELMWFSAGKMIPSFEEAAFSLKKPNDISAPVLTPYGWHIVKLLEKKPLESFETLESNIRQKVSKDRGEVNKKVLLERLKRENNFVENTKAVEAMLKYADSTLLQGKWTYTEDPKNNPLLFSIKDDKYTQYDFFKYVKQKQRPKKNISPAQYMRTLYKEYTEENLIQWEEAHLEEKYYDYKMLVREYRDGILLFQLMDEKVWSKAIEDTAGLKKFFANNREKYRWDYRAQAKIFNVENQQTLEKVKEELKKETWPVKDYSKKELSFEQNKSEIRDEDKRKLDILSHELHKNKSFIADITAGAEFTEGPTLAGRRASQIKRYLSEQGIDSSRINVTVKVGVKNSKNKSADRTTVINMLTSSAKELEKYFNANSPLTLQVTEGTFQKGENDILSQVEWKTGSYTIEKGGRIYYIIISKVEEPRQKQFEETRGLIISDYQAYLEQEWIENLRKKYPVTVNEEEVRKIIKK